MTNAVKTLRRIQKQMYGLEYAMAALDYDAQTVAPSESAEGRGDALEQLSSMHYSLAASPELPRLFEEARAGELTEQEAAEVHELEKQYNQISRIPQDEFAAFTKLTSNAVSAWEKAKSASDFSLFAPYLEKIVATRRHFGQLLDSTKPAYDVLLDQFEEGLTMEKCDVFFNQLKEVITPLVRRIVTEGKAPRADFLNNRWPIDRQRELSSQVMDLMRIDKSHCILGESEHPFTSGFSKWDVRITTHFHEEDMASNLYSVVHEGGHSLYELHLADRLEGTCLADGASMSIHESQSRLFENYIGRSLPFVKCIWPLLTALFPEQLKGVTAEDFYKAINTCQPSLIRTESDEVTYCLHIMVRYEIEKQLMNGTLEVKDLPKTWNALMKELLGVDVPCDAQGVLQDIHWACGDIGYFPSYALGTAYAAQIVAAMRKELDVDALVEEGDLAPINDWLTQHIWQYGKEKNPEWLIQNACGAPFDPKFFTDYLVEKYSAIYEL